MSQRSRFPALRNLTLLTLALLLMVLAATVPAKPPGGGGNPPPPPLPTYTLQSLGTLGGATSTAEGINDFGDVVGNADESDGSSSAYLYTAAHGMERIDDLTQGPMTRPRMPEFGPDGNLYVVDGGGADGVDASVVRFDGVTGEFVDYFVLPGAGGLYNAIVISFDQNGDAYVPTRSGPSTDLSRIAKFDGSSGAYLGDFVPDQGASLKILGQEFGPDVGGAENGDPDGVPDLFVTSNLTHEVVAFSGADGQPLGPFVTAGSGGLDSPHGLTFHDIDGDGDPELFVSAQWNCEVLMYDGLDGSFLGVFADSVQVSTYADEIKHIEFGPDGNLYIGSHLVGYTNGSHVLRVNATTGAVDLYVAPRSGGLSSAPTFLEFDSWGNLYANSTDTNQVLKYQGPGGANPGAFIEIFVEGVGFTLITARDINAAGQIVGMGHPLGRRLLFGERAAYRYTPPGPGETIGRVEDLRVPNLFSPIPQEATAINNNGDVAGHFYADDGLMHAFLWPTETPATEDAIDLGTLAGGDTYVTAISDRVGGDLQVAGYAQTSSGYRAWRYNTATGTMQNLGLLGGSSGYSRGWDMNNLGEVTGLSTNGSKVRGFVFASSMSDVGTLGGNNSYAYGINDFGDVVGTADDNTRASKNKHQAFVKTSSTGIYKLEPQITNLPGSMTLKIQPRKINNAGQIIGPGDVGNPNVAYIITPN